MRKVNIPNYGIITIKNVIFDVNGTLQFIGKISEDLVVKFNELKKFYDIYLVSSDIRGNLKELAEKLGVKHIKVNPEGKTEAEAKNEVLSQLGKDTTVAVGNGNNDALMLKNAVIGIAIIGSEGATLKSVLNSDVVVPSPLNAIDFLLDEKIMIGMLRS